MALKDLIVRGPRPSPVAARPKKRGPYKTRAAHVRGGSLEPQGIDNETWFYEDQRGLLVVHEFRTDDGQWIRTDQFLIPWRKFKAYAERRLATQH